MRTRNIFAAIAVSVLSLTGMATAASATTDGVTSEAATCPEGRICLYTGHNATGRVGVFQWGSPDLRGQGIDRAIWVINRHSLQFCLYDGYNYAGPPSRVSRTIPQGFVHTPVSSLRPC
jgi:hypothetical protein